MRYAYRRHKSEGNRLLLVVSLMDATVKVFFDDSLKMYISMYELGIAGDVTFRIIGRCAV